MPEYVASAAVAALNLVPGTVAATVVYGTVYVGTVAAIAYGANALAADMANQKNPGSLLDIQVRSDSPRQIIVGERTTAGSMVGRYVTGAGNNNLIEVIALADHRCQGVLEYIVNGIVQATNLVHGVRTSIPAYRSEPDRLWVTWYDGRHDQTADAVLAGYTLTNQPDWTSNHRGRGVSYAIVEMQWDDDVMMAPVQSQFRMLGGLWYDRRLDDTAGGVGDHRHMDPDTWEFTRNPDVFADHYQLGIVPYPNAVNSAGTPLYSWGVRLKPWQLPFERFKEQADICDEQVLKKDGVTYQDRYALNAIFDATSTHRDILTGVAKAKAGRIVDYGGRLGIIGPEAKTSVMTLTDQDLIVGEQSKYSDGLSISDLKNVFRGTFPDPLQGFRPVEYPPLTKAEWVEDDGGDELPAEVNIEVDTDEERVQRLVWLHANDNRRQARMTEAYRPKAIRIQDGDWFTRAGAKFGDGKMFQALRVEYVVSKERGLFVVIASKEVDPDDVAWAANMAANLSRPDPPSDEALFIPLPAPIITAVASQVEGATSSWPSLTISWSNATDTRIRSALIDCVPVAGGPVSQVTVEAGPGAENEVVLDLGIADDVEYHVGVKFQGLVKPSEWSNIVSVTTGDTYVVGEATSVPWSGVTGAGRPADNADVTAANTAAAIAGQGSLATANQVNLGASGNVYRDNTSTHLTDALAVTALGTAAAIASQGAFATLNSAAYGSALLTGFAALAAKATIDNAALVGSGVIVYTALSSTAVRLGTNIVRNDGSTSLTDALAVTSLGTAAAITGQGALATLAQVNLGASGRVYRDDGTTRVTDALAITSLGTAAAITGQGALATKATIDNSSLVGASVILYTALSSTAVRLGTNITRSDGTTSLTDALAVTSLGTAAAFTGQGALATLNTINSSGLMGSAVVAYTALTSTAVRLGTNITRNDGTTSLTDALAVTSLGTAAAITGQGALATKATIDSTGLVGTNVIAYTALTTTAVRLGVNITRADGSTSLTDALAVTSLGTAAAITGQGALATKATIDSTTLVGAGVIAYTALTTTAVRLGTNITRSDGTTSLTDALAVTSLGTAAAITGQGWGATAAQSAIDNDLVPVTGYNKHPTFQAWASTLPDNYSMSGAMTVSKNTTNKIYGAHCLDITAPASANQWLQTLASPELRVPSTSEWMTAEWEIELVSGDLKRAGLYFVNLRPDSGNNTGWRLSFYDEHAAATAVGKYSGAKTFFANASTGSASGEPTASRFYVMMNWSSLTGGADSAKQIIWHRALVRPATQQEIAAALGLQTTGKLSSIAGVFGDDLKETSGGTVASLANFKTLLGTAAAITSQGALATLAQVNLGASGRVYRDDGTTRVTDALAITSLGTAAAITGQGALATKATIDSTSLMGSAVVAYTALTSTAVRLGTNITRADGSTSLTDALAVTSLGTAAAITGQGSLATASSAAWGSQVSGRPTNLAALSGSEVVNNALVPAGANGLVDTQFRWQTTYWSKDSVSGSTVFSVETSTLGMRKSVVTGSGVTVNSTDYVRQHSIVQRGYFPCKPGDTIGGRVLVGGVNVSAIDVRVAFRNAAGSLVGNTTPTQVSSSILDGTGEEATFHDLASSGVAPASTECACIEVRGIASSAAPVLRIACALLAELPTGQTVVPAYSPGIENEIGANVTETRVAASITGQGAFATVSTAAYGSGLLTGFGTLAARADVYFGSSFLLETSGGSQATLANFKTSSGVAASISGQGSLATLSSVTGQYLAAGVGRNALYDTEFRYLSSYWRSTAQSGSVSTAVNTSTNGIRRATLTGSGVTVGNFLQFDTNLQVNAFPIAANEWVEASAYLGGTNVSDVRIFIDFRDASGVNTGFSSFINDATPSAGGGELSTFERLAVIAQAPANTVKALLCIRGIASTSAPVLQVTKPLLARALQGQTEASPWAPGFDGEAGGNITENRTASAITGQGGLATLGYVTIGTNLRLAGGTTVATTADVVTASGTASAISGQGGLATLSFVTIATNLRLADGTTVATTAMVVTASGTAAAISGQGTQATANSQRGTSYSGTPTEGSWWADTSVTPNKLRYYTSGAWQAVATLQPDGITASASPSSVSVSQGTSGFTSGTITITPSGGSGYSYLVQFIKDGGVGNVTLSSTTSATFTATSTLTAGQDVSGTILVTVYATGGVSTQVRIPLSFARND